MPMHHMSDQRVETQTSVNCHLRNAIRPKAERPDPINLIYIKLED